MVERAEHYKSKVELGSGPLGTLSVAQGAERAVLLRTVRQGTEWSAPLLDAWAASSSRAKTLHHPSLLAVIDVARSKDGLDIATEYVQGVPLSLLMSRARERRRPVPPEIAQRIVLDLARSVANTHELLAEQGEPRLLAWVHPESVLVTSGDDALIADVGLLGLEAVAEHASLEAFRAPELIAGREVMPSSAVYSLGILLWELLAGRDALGEGAAVTKVADLRERALAGAVPRLDLVAPTAPPLLIGIVAQAINRDPSARFPDAAALAETLSVGKRNQPGEIVRFMNDLCGDLVEAERGAVVRPQVAATSWRPTVPPTDDVPLPQIPRAPRAVGLAAFRPTPPAPAIVIAESAPPIREPSTDGAEPPGASDPGGAPAAEAMPPTATLTVEIPEQAVLAAARTPQATLPLMLVKKPISAPTATELSSTAADQDEPPPRPRNRAGLLAIVILVVAAAAALVVVALRKQSDSVEPDGTEPTRSASPGGSIAAPKGQPETAGSADSAPASGSASRPARADAPLRDRDRLEKPSRKKSDAGVAPSSTWGKEEEPAHPSDNPYSEPKAPSGSGAAPPPASSSKFGY